LLEQNIKSSGVHKIECGFNVKGVYSTNDTSFLLSEDGIAYSWPVNEREGPI